MKHTQYSGGVTSNQTKKDITGISNADKNASYKADDAPLDSANKLENVGLAVFYGDLLVGELNAIETLCHLILTNQIETCVISIPSPFNTSEDLDLLLESRKATKNSVDIVNGAPFAKSNVYLTGRILTYDADSNYIESGYYTAIENSAEKYMTSQINSYLNKISKTYKSDIVGFGKFAAKNFLTQNDWQEYDWRTNFKNTFFDVDVHVVVASGYLLET